MVSRENEAKASKYRRGQQKPGHAAAQVPDDLIDRACTAWCAEFPPALPFDQMTEGGKRNLKIGIAAIIGVLDGELAALRKRLEAHEKPVTDDEKFHFKDDVVMGAVGGTEYMRNSVRRMLYERTSGEKWSLYRGIATLVIAQRAKGE